MQNQFLTNYTEITFLEKIKDSLRHCTSFCFSVSFIKKAGLVLLFKDIEAAVERGATGRFHPCFDGYHFLLQSQCTSDL